MTRIRQRTEVMDRIYRTRLGIQPLINAVPGQVGNGTTAQERRGIESPGSLALTIRGSVEAERADDNHCAPKQHALAAAHRLLPPQFLADVIRHAAADERRRRWNVMQTQHQPQADAADPAEL
jgi:hypothetical protein